MKLLQGLFDKARPAFSSAGRLSRLAPLFDAAEHFVYWPATRTGTAPHVRDPLDVKRFMSTVIVALIPCVLAGLYFFGLRVLGMILISYVVGGAVEILFAVVRKEEINEGFLVTGLLFPLILPPSIPLWMVAVGVAFGVLVGKEIFGGTGRNLFNPALLGRCFLFLAYSKAMSTGWLDTAQNTTVWGGFVHYLNADAVTGATPLEAVGSFPLWRLFLGNIPGTLGGTSALAILIGGAFLVFTKVANYRQIAGMLISFVVTMAIMVLAKGEALHSVAYHFLAGGMLFGAFFMATDPVTAPATNPARWAYGVLIGVLTVLMRLLTPLPEGVMFAILLGNIAAPVLDEIVIRWRMGRLAGER